MLLSRPYAAARLSHVVRDAQAEEDDGVIDTPEDVQIIKVESRCLEKVVEFLKHYHEEPLVEIKTPLEDNTFEGNVKQEWYQNFLKGIDQPMLFDLVTAANFMAIRKFIFLFVVVLLDLHFIISIMANIVSFIPPIINFQSLSLTSPVSKSLVNSWENLLKKSVRSSTSPS